MRQLGRGARAASRAGAVAACVAVAAVGGCRGAHDDGPTGAAGTTGAAADLQRDLDAAAASAAFAPPLGANRTEVPARFVSALELGASPDSAGTAHTTAPQGHSAGRARARRSAPPSVTLVRARHRSAATIAGEQVADASPAAAEGGVSEDVASAGSGSYTAPIETGPAPGTGRSAGAGVGQGRRRSSGAWNVVGAVLGTAMGVVIRGGGVGDDHCDIHTRRTTTNGRSDDPRSRRPVFLPGRSPAGVPVGGFIGVSLGNPPHVVVEGPSDRPMGAVPQTPGRL